MISQRCKLGRNFVVAKRQWQVAAAVSPGRNQNLCLDQRLTIAICHKLSERAHNLRMTTQPNKCPAHFSITKMGKKWCTNYITFPPKSQSTTTESGIL